MILIHEYKVYSWPKRYDDLQGPVVVRRALGFSFLELIFVISIMAILGALVAPRYLLASARYRADLCVQRMAADARRVQTLARSAGSSYSIHYDVSANEYVMADVQALDGVEASSTVPLQDAPYHATLVSSVFGAGDTLQFDGWGSPVSGGTVVMTVGSEARTLIVDGQTGEVTVE